MLTKKTGMRKPNPMASSLLPNASGRCGTAGSVGSARSARRRMIPARNAPRIIASPKSAATTPNASAKVIATRTRSGALVFSSREASARSRGTLLIRWIPTTATAVTTTKPPSRPSSVAGLLDAAEKNTETGSSGTSSPTEPAAMTSRPKIVSSWPESLCTGTRTPSEVAMKMMPTSGPSVTRPLAWNPYPSPSPKAAETTKARPTVIRECRSKRRRSISKPARNSR